MPIDTVIGSRSVNRGCMLSKAYGPSRGWSIAAVGVARSQWTVNREVQSHLGVKTRSRTVLDAQNIQLKVCFSIAVFNVYDTIVLQTATIALHVMESPAETP